MDDTPGEYVIWSNEHRAWWRANSRGYAKDFDDAGVYSRGEAIKICGVGRDGWGAREVPAEIPVRLADAKACIAVFEDAFSRIK